MGVAGLFSDAEGRTRWRLMLALLLGLLLAVRLLALLTNRTDLFFDEAQYWSWSQEPAFGYYSKPPLVAWLIGATTAVCGQGEACIRVAAPLLHTVTAAALFALGSRLYGVSVGFLSALVFATLPGVSLSSGIISTDVPLLTAWAIALWALVVMIDDKRAWWPGVVAGLALGAGLNAKYAMAYFVVCLGVYLAFTPERRWLLRDRRLWLALGLGIALIVPNLVWNASNSFATFSHTADNAKWSGSLFRPGKAAEFLAGQFGVFGPILFCAYLIIAWRWWRRGLEPADRLLLAFSLPIILIVTIQAFISRAHANWAAAAYVAAAVLVTQTMVRDVARRWLSASFWLHGAIVLVLAVATAFAGRFALPGGADPFARTLGWRELADGTRSRLEAARKAGRPFGAVITDERATTAELLYYMRDEPTPVLAWKDSARVRDHYELTRPFKAGSPEPVLLVALHGDARSIAGQFATSHLLGEARLPAGTASRRVWFFHLSGFRGQ